MKKRPKKEKKPEGNDIQIFYDDIQGDYMVPRTLRLTCVSLAFATAISDRWVGSWKNEQIWVEFRKPVWEIVCSENFPYEHKSAAVKEVKRITSQYN